MRHARTTSLILASLLCLPTPAAAQAKIGHVLGIDVGFAASFGCALYDTTATAYWVAKGTIYEANPLLAPVVNNPPAFVARSAALSLVPISIAYYIREAHPKWAATLLWSNAALRCWGGARADHLGRPRAR